MAITNGYCTLAEVKAALRLSDSVDDTLLENAIEGASRRVDGYCGTFFYQTSSVLALYIWNEYFHSSIYKFFPPIEISFPPEYWILFLPQNSSFR